jgi:O-antigen/teichoic acid export membrane protein
MPDGTPRKLLDTPGLEAALIQRSEYTSAGVNSVWIVQILKGTAISLLVLASAGLIAYVLEEPDAVPVLRVIAVIPLITGLGNMHIVSLRRALDFRAESRLHLIPAGVQLVVSVTWAVYDATAMALAVGAVAASTTRALLTFTVVSVRPRLSFDWGELRRLLPFGRWTWASSILAFLITQGDDLVVGALLGSAALGTYQIAYRLSNTATTEVAHVVNQLSFPLLSRFQENTEAFVSLIIRALAVAGAAILPLAIGVGVIAEPLVSVLLGPQWAGAVPIIQILAVWGAVRGLGAVTSPASWHSAGRTPWRSTNSRC